MRSSGCCKGEMKKTRRGSGHSSRRMDEAEASRGATSEDLREEFPDVPVEPSKIAAEVAYLMAQYERGGWKSYMR